MTDGMTDSAAARSPASRREEHEALLRAYDLLAGTTEPALDRVVAMAATLLDTPIAALSFSTAGREWFVAERGLGLAETAGDGSPGAQVLASGDPLVVLDCAADPRFADHPLVSAAPGLRFYAAVPVVTCGGIPLGVLAVADTRARPRSTAARLELLVDLAAVVSDLLELRREARRETDSGHERFHLAAIVDSSDDAILSKTLDGTILSWNAGAQALYGYRAEEIIGKHISILLPPDRTDEVVDILERVRRGGAVEHFDTERVRRDGRVVQVSVNISPIRDASGAVIAASTIARDVSERRRLQTELEAHRSHRR